MLILLCTLIWGSAFVAQKTGAAHYGPFTLTCYRNILAGAFLAVVIFVRNRMRGAGRAPVAPRIAPATQLASLGGYEGGDGTVCLGGALSGVVLFAAMAAQQLGIEHTTPGISAFLTANYILIVPFLAWLIGRGCPRLMIWMGVVLALVGTYLICVEPVSGHSPFSILNFQFGKGEAWTLLCAILYAVQIMVVDRYAPRCDVLVFSMVQMFVAALCAAPFLLLPSEAARLTFSHFTAGWWSLFYVGILSSGIAYTLQNLGQARTPAALAALVMSFESVVGAVSGYLFFGDTLGTAQIAGCLLVFTAIVIASLTSRQ